MIINRHNYEEFFLMYVDQELDASDRTAVELFVAQNPDVAEELKMLQEAVLPAEIIEFKEKEALYNKVTGISQHNYEAYFLLSIDRELTDQENLEVEKFVLKHPELQNEFKLLEQTKLEAEQLIFEGKEKLYRHQAKERPAIPIMWMRISAAAVFIGLAVMIWTFFQPGTIKLGNDVVSIKNEAIKRLPPAIQQVQSDTTPTHKSESIAPDKIASVTDIPRKASGGSFKNIGAKGRRYEVAAVKNKAVQTSAPAVIAKIIETPVQDRKAFAETIASAKIDKGNTSGAATNNSTNAFILNKNAVPQEVLATQTVYEEIDTRADDQDKNLYIGSVQINKNRLRGLFRKATGFLGVKNNDNDGERTLRIAGFEIKSK